MSISEPFRHRNDSFQSDIFSSNIGITDVDVGCQISPRLRPMSMPTYEAEFTQGAVHFFHPKRCPFRYGVCIYSSLASFLKTDFQNWPARWLLKRPRRGWMLGCLLRRSARRRRPLWPPKRQIRHSTRQWYWLPPKKTQKREKAPVVALMLLLLLNAGKLPLEIYKKLGAGDPSGHPEGRREVLTSSDGC